MAVPILPVRDLGKRPLLGARRPRRPGVRRRLRVRAGGAEELVHLDVHPSVDPATNLAACYVHVDDVPGWHERLTAAGLPASPVRDEPWGMRSSACATPAATSSGSAARSRTTGQPVRSSRCTVTVSPAALPIAVRTSVRTGQLVRAVAQRHERAGERVPVDGAAHLDQPAGAEELGRARHLHVGPAARARALHQVRRELARPAGRAPASPSSPSSCRRVCDG